MIRSFSILIFLHLFLGQLCLAAQKFGYEYKSDVDGWLRLHIVPATWAEARLQCRLEGGTSASPATEALASAMKAMMSENERTLDVVYTGISAIISKGVYTTIDGVPLSNISLDWALGEPNNFENSEDCLVMSGAGELADVNCSRVFRYFCFKDSAKMTTTKCGTWDSEYQFEPRTGSCYKFHAVARSWRRAAAACRAEHAHLAVINSQSEAQALKELFARNPQHKLMQQNRDLAFVGFWDWQEQGEWLTIFGQTFAEAGFGEWSSNEPNNFLGKEFCGTIHRNGLLNDFPCDTKSAFICEITL